MRVNIEIPDIVVYEHGFANFWLDFRYSGKSPADDKVRILTMTYMRLTEAALTEYRLGKEKVEEFWTTHSHFNFGAALRATTHFECCLADMKLGIRVFTVLRKDKALPCRMRTYLSQHKPKFVKDAENKTLLEMRDEIHHVEEHVIRGKIIPDQYIALLPTGPETDHPTEPGQAVKTIDRLVIGGYELLFSDLAALLKEMVEFAHEIGKRAG